MEKRDIWGSLCAGVLLGTAVFLLLVAILN